MIETFQSESVKACVSVLMNPDAFGTSLYLIAIDRFGAEIHEWEPEMFDMEFRDEFGIDVPAGNQSKLLAIVSSLASEVFYTDPTAFGSICEILSGGSDRISDFPPMVTPAELAWGVTEVLLLDDTPGVVSDEVAAYAGVVLDEAGFINPHQRLSFASMPSVYRGSTPDYAQREEQIIETHHSILVDQFLLDQSNQLIAEMESLPFVTEKMLEEIAGDAAKINFRLRVESAVYAEVAATQV